MAEFNWTVDDIKRAQRDFSNNFMRLDCIRTESYDVAIDCMTECIEKKAAAVQPVNQWISVQDRLPENNKLVLCYAQSTTGEGCCYILGTLSNDEFWFLQAHDGHHLSFPNLHLVVTHWQPLPDPPVNL